MIERMPTALVLRCQGNVLFATSQGT